MNIFDPIDIYCERTAAGLFNEPLDALTNLSFFIAAWLLLRRYKAAGLRDIPVLILIGLVALVGTGSSLFHTFANGLTQLCDTIPIMVLVCYFLWVVFRRLVLMARPQAAIALLLFLIVAASMGKIPPGYNFNGSVAYFPCLAALLLISLHLRRKNHAATSDFLKAAGLFAVSLTFRSLDMALCPAWPFGVHFLWHIFNGAVLYILVCSLMKQPAIAANK